MGRDATVDLVGIRPGVLEDACKLGLPDNLRDKIVLELYSGGSENSLGRLVGERGQIRIGGQTSR